MEKKNNFGMGKKIGYGIGDLGGNLVSAAAGAFVTMYYTDSVLLSAAFIGTMMLFTRLLDGISDIIMGIIIDKTYTKYGTMGFVLRISINPVFYFDAERALWPQ